MNAPDGFYEFARWQVSSADNDPVYPVLRSVLDTLCIERSSPEALQFVLLYVAYYDLTSALYCWLAVDGWHGQDLPDDLAGLPTGIERRGLRTPDRMRRHLASIAGHLDSGLWPRRNGEPPRAAWRRTFADLQSPEFNGRWAAYKTSELLQKVLGWPLEPTDAGHEHSTGPLHGLLLLDPGLKGATVAQLDDVTEDLRASVEDRLERSVDVAEVETLLCDWHSLVDGRYYVGHDIDQMQTAGRQMLSDRVGAPEVPQTAAIINNSRLAALDPRWLGEVNGWSGVRKPLRRLYRDSGRLDWWTG